jgi:hypothetical protein
VGKWKTAKLQEIMAKQSFRKGESDDENKDLK